MINHQNKKDKTMKRLIYTIGTILAIVLLVSACSNYKYDSSNKKSIAILKLGSHEIIDMVEESIKKELRNYYDTNITIRTYNANFDDTLLSQSASQIANTNFDVVVPITTPASIILANKINKNQKMIFSFVSTPKSIWGKQSKNRPSNITGTSDQLDYQKNLELIKIMFPKAKKIGYLVNASEENARDGLMHVKRLSKDLNLSIIEVNVNASIDVSNAARTIVRGVDVFLVGGDNTVVSGLGSLLNIATKHKKPVFAVEHTSVKQGCIAAFGIDYNELGKETSNMIIDVLNGKQIDSLGVYYFSKVKLYINEHMANYYDIDLNKFKAYKVYK